MEPKKHQTTAGPNPFENSFLNLEQLLAKQYILSQKFVLLCLPTDVHEGYMCHPCCGIS